MVVRLLLTIIHKNKKKYLIAKTIGAIRVNMIISAKLHNLYYVNLCI